MTLYAKQTHRYRKPTNSQQRAEGRGRDKLEVWD